MKRKRKVALTVVLLVLVPLLCFHLLQSFQASAFFSSEVDQTRRPSSCPSSTPRPLVESGVAYVARLPWHHLSHDESFRVVSVIDDHRIFPSNLPGELRKKFTFPAAIAAAADGRHLHVFQMLLAVHRDTFDLHSGAVVTNQTFRSAELRWLDGDRRLHALQPESCVVELPRNVDTRMQLGALYLEAVVRCAFLIDDRRLASILDARRGSCDGASITIHAGMHADEEVRFPLAEVIHFPNARQALELLPRPLHGFPTAPWAATLGEGVARRASGDAAKVRVAALTSRFSWNTDVELWLLWTLDVVGVDHVVLEIVSPSLDPAVVERALARHPGVRERVSLVDVQVPMSEAWYALQIGRVCDSMVRWQADLDFVLVIDTDEFVQLFDYDDDHDDIPSHDHDEDDEGHERQDRQQRRLTRVDVKTFIARHEALIRRHGQVRMWRPHVRRSSPNGQAEPRLAELLAQLAGLDGNATLGALQGMPDFKAADAEGKSLFSLTAALNPYLHFNQGWPYPPADHARGFMLHIREPFKNGKSVNGSSEWTVERLLDRTRGVVPQ